MKKKRSFGRIIALITVVMMTFIQATPVSFAQGDQGSNSIKQTTQKTGEASATEISHNKTIADNGDGTYKLKLDVTGVVASTTNKPLIDVLVIADVSGSMAYDMAGHGVGDKQYTGDSRNKILKRVAKNLSKSLFDNKDIDARMALVQYSGNSSKMDSARNDASTVESWTNSNTTIDSAISSLGNDGGTNCQAGLQQGENVLKSARANAQKVVIFLSDGQPTFYYGSDGMTKGLGYADADSVDKKGNLIGEGSCSSAAYTEAAGINNIDSFYAVGISNDADSTFLNTLKDKPCPGKNITRKYYPGADEQELTKAFSAIAGQIVEFKYSNVKITDPLSTYVDMVDPDKVDFTVKAVDKAGNPVSLTGKNITAAYNKTTRTVTLNFPDNYTLEQDVTYSVEFNVTPSQAAMDYLSENGTYPENMVGDAGTDAPGNTTSSGKPGFYSNNGATVKYTFKDKEETKAYKNPVVQVKTTDLDVTKIWKDANNQDNKRLTSVKFQLMKQIGSGEATAVGNPVELTARDAVTGNSNQWQKIKAWKNLPTMKGKQAITYTIKEVGETNGKLGAYTVEYDGFTVTNSYTPEATKITATKVWADGNDQDGVRPTSVDFQLQKTVDGKISNVGSSKTLSAGADKIWQSSELQATWKDLPKYENGKAILYTVVELNAAGKSIVQGGTLDKNYTVSYSADRLTVTNTHAPELIPTVAAKKVWDDANDRDGKRPTTIKFQLQKKVANAEPIDVTDKVAILTAGSDNKWDAAELTAQWTNLPKYENGKQIAYSVVEIGENNKPVANGGKYNDYYTVDYSANGLTVTNKHKTATKSISVEKLWSDKDSNDRPTSVTVQLKADGANKGEEVVLNSAGWTHTWDNLDVYKAGQEIEYTVVETKIGNTAVENSKAAGYISKVFKDGNKFTVVNAKEPKKTITAGLDDGKLVVGKEVTYKIAYYNTEDKTADITITDKLPKELSYVGSSDGGINAKGTVTWNLTGVKAGEGGYVTVTAKVNATAVVETENSATVKIGNNEYNTSIKTPIKPEKPVKTANTDETLSIGDKVTYTITYRNNTAEKADMTITDVLATGLSFDAASDDGTNNNGTVTWNIKAVEPGKGGQVTLTATVNDAAVVKVDNTAQVAIGHDPSVDTNTVTNKVNPEKPTKAVDPQEGTAVDIGQTLNYTVNYRNNTDKVADIVITDVLDKGLTFKSAQQGGTYTDNNRTITWTIKDVQPGVRGSVNFAATVNKDAIYKVDNKATVKVGTESKETNEVKNPVNPEQPTKTVDKGAGTIVKVGDILTYTIHYRNSTKDTANITITDKLQKGLSFEEASNDGTNNNGTVTWTINNVASGERGTVTLKVKVNDDAVVQVENSADVVVGNGATMTTKPVTNLITPKDPVKTVSAGDKATVKVGDKLTYTIAYRNNTATAAHVVITDKLDKGLIFEKASNNGTYDKDSHTITWTITNVPSGGAGSTVSFEATVADTAVDKVDNQAGVKIGNEKDVNTNKVTNPVDPIDPTKTVNVPANETKKIGDDVTYTINYRNNTTEDADITITDKLQAGLTFKEASNDGDEKDGTVTWEIKNVKPGVRGSVTVTATINDKAVVQVENTASIKVGHESEVTAKSIPVKVDPVPPVKTVDPASESKVDLGDTLTYTVKYRNNDNKNADLTITDKLDKGLEFVSEENGGTYDKVSHTITWTLTNQEPAQTGTVTFKAKVKADAVVKVNNIASVQINNEAEIKTNEVTNPINPKDPVKTSNIPEKGEVKVGDSVDYTISYRNNTAETADIVITDKLAEGLTYTDSTPSGTYDKNDHTVTWTIKDVKAGAEGTVTLNTKVNEKAITTVENKAVVKVGNDSEQETKPVRIPVIPTVEKTVTKIWDDESDTDEIRPTSIKVQLLADGENYGKPIELTGTGDQWSYTWKNLPQYTDVETKKDIVYTVKEVEKSTGYDEPTYSEDTFTITNFHLPDKYYYAGAIKVVKKVVANNVATKVTDDFYVGVFSDPEFKSLVKDYNEEDAIAKIQLTGASEGEAVIDDLPVGPKGKAIKYYVTETDKNGVPVDSNYEFTPSVENGKIALDVTTLTNAETPTVITNSFDNLTEASGVKEWRGDTYVKDQFRPKSITVELLQNGNQESYDTKEVTPDADGNWTYTFTKLPKYDDNGDLYNYSVREVVVDGYTSTADGMDLYNELSAYLSGSMKITKNVRLNDKPYDTTGVFYAGIFTDENCTELLTMDKDGKDAPAVVALPIDGDSVTVQVDGLPLGEDGAPVTYYVAETDNQGKAITKGNEFTIDIKNQAASVGISTTPEVTINNNYSQKASLTGTKTWVDDNDAAGERPDSIKVTLTQNGKVYRDPLTDSALVKTVTAKDNWSYSFVNLPEKDADGNAYKYSVIETGVEGDYTVEVKGLNLTNTLEKPQYYYEGNIEITKKVMLRNKAYNVDDVYYAGVFADKDYKDLMEDENGDPVIFEIALDDESQATIKVPVATGPDGKPATYYVTEVDENGTPVSEVSGLAYTTQVQGGICKVGKNQTAKVKFINTYNVKKTPQTGDDSNMMLWIMMILMTMSAIAVICVLRRKDIKNRG